MELTIATIEDEIIRLVATKSGEKPAQLRAFLRAKGDEMPIDSQRTMEVLAELDYNLSVDIPANQKTDIACKSITRLAKYVFALSQKQKTKMKTA